jgi:hypothetical protein
MFAKSAQILQVTSIRLQEGQNNIWKLEELEKIGVFLLFKVAQSAQTCSMYNLG